MNLNTLFATYLKRLRPAGGKGHADPARDWRLLLLVALLVLVASVATNVWFFLRVLEDKPPAPAASDTLKEADLGPLQALFERRSAEEARYRTEYQFVDPSL